jgi:IS30 family transposase
MSALLSADEIARRLHVSRATAYREMRRMLHVVVGTRALRVTEAAFDAYLQRRTQAPAKLRPTKAARPGEEIRPILPRTKPPPPSAEPIPMPDDPRNRLHD